MKENKTEFVEIEEKRPVVAVEHDGRAEFEATCAELVEKGYLLVTASCGFIPESPQFDYQESWQAVYALPEYTLKGGFDD